MGYDTNFEGSLKFGREMTGKELFIIKQYLNKDLREHPEWGKFTDDDGYELTHMDLELLDNFDGIKWNGSEKPYNMTEKVNILIKLVQKDIPDFSLKGSLQAQGDEWDDRWTLSMKKNVAHKTMKKIVGERVTCPHCEEEFILEGE